MQDFYEPMTDEDDFDNWHEQVSDMALARLIINNSGLDVDEDDIKKAIADAVTNTWRPGLAPSQWVGLVVESLTP